MKIKAIHLQTAITLPGTKLLGAVDIFPQKYPNATFELSEHGVAGEESGHRFLIPYANVKSLMFHKEEV